MSWKRWGDDPQSITWQFVSRAAGNSSVQPLCHSPNFCPSSRGQPRSVQAVSPFSFGKNSLLLFSNFLLLIFSVKSKASGIVIRPRVLWTDHWARAALGTMPLLLTWLLWTHTVGIFPCLEQKGRSDAQANWWGPSMAFLKGRDTVEK